MQFMDQYRPSYTTSAYTFRDSESDWVVYMEIINGNNEERVFSSTFITFESLCHYFVLYSNNHANVSWMLETHVI